jgi:hypothetical protein
MPSAHSMTAIKNYIQQVLPGFSVEQVGNAAAIEVCRGAKRVVLRYGPDQLSDLQEALTNSSLPVRYKNGLVRDISLGALVAVGKEGMAPDIDASRLVVEEDLDWNPYVRLITSFDGETARRLYEGLKRLYALAGELIKSDVPMPDIEKERSVMEPIIAFYEKQRHLKSTEVTGESLSYLKAAAFCWILELEEKKNAVISQRVKAAQSVRIFELLEEFWLSRPFDRITLPPIVRDYISHRAATAKTVAAGPGPSLDVGPQLKKLDPRLEERWRGAWQALRSTNPDKVSQAANSMVEVLDKVIARVCGDRPFKEILAERYPLQERFILAQRAAISALKESLHAVKHETNAQSVHTAQDLMHATEGVIRTLLR